MNQETAQKRKKVLFLITKGTWGGAQRYVFDLATHLPHDHYEAHVAYGTPGKMVEDLARAGIPTSPLPSLGRDIALISDIRSFFEILWVIRKVRPDVLHLNSSKAALLGAFAGRMLFVKKIVFTVHGWPFKEERGFLAQRFFYLMSWKTAIMSHAVIVVSPSDEKAGRAMRGVGKKVRLISIGIQSPEFMSREDAAAALAITAESPRIVTIAELTKNKGVRFAIEAIALLKERSRNISYFVIGEGEEREQLQQLARERGVADHVHFLGFVLEAAKYLRAFDALVLASVKEGAPYVLLEAASAGIPVLATEAVDTAYSIRVRVRDAHALADGIEKILARDVIAAQRYDLREMVQKTTALY